MDLWLPSSQGTGIRQEGCESARCTTPSAPRMQNLFLRVDARADGVGQQRAQEGMTSGREYLAPIFEVEVMIYVCRVFGHALRDVLFYNHA